MPLSADSPRDAGWVRVPGCISACAERAKAGEIMGDSGSGTVDVSDREMTRRRAVAEGTLLADAETIEAVRKGHLPKADPLATARAAALLAIKATPRLIPHCHPINVTAASVDFEFSDSSIRVICEVHVVDRTGPPVEALCGVTTALLTLYDVIKHRCPGAELKRIALLEKEGGRSGHWRAENERGAGAGGA